MDVHLKSHHLFLLCALKETIFKEWILMQKALLSFRAATLVVAKVFQGGDECSNLRCLIYLCL